MAANQITAAESYKKAAELQTLFSKMKNIYYCAEEFTKDAYTKNGISVALELPVLEDGVTFNTGEPDVTENKLTTGAIWTSRADKGDSDISFQVASIDGAINDLFLTKVTSASITGLSLKAALGIDGTFAGDSYSLDVNKVTGSLIMTDDNGQTVIIVTNIEAYGGLVVSDGDSPAYFNVVVTPKDNTEGAALIILHKTA